MAQCPSVTAIAGGRIEQCLKGDKHWADPKDTLHVSERANWEDEDQLRETSEGGFKAHSFDAGGIIYVTASEDGPPERFTAADLIAECGGNERKARDIFARLMWTHPATLLDLDGDEESE